ncbi:prevent-host-death family protein [Caldicoprobacter guelmensis]|uniref:type II toxin-antitoxin system Phd/YefM family antitoxin n=1 Tax=Caldicoprobacter guelmensis TaxID=1170224 RepID=UPI00195DF8F2|nr:type II toxin-antitoxin system prevent-host-death family antitoxin [Caldicoprobacter guelmensis]MBM7581848.1 prevent-host-death family protein [Caldicoprobacter guelmensis]
MEHVGVRELKNSLSRYLKLVKSGKTIRVTERGKTIAKLVPAQDCIPQGIIEMLNKEVATWNGEKPKGMVTLRTVTKEKNISDIVSEDRR